MPSPGSPQRDKQRSAQLKTEHRTAVASSPALPSSSSHAPLPADDDDVTDDVVLCPHFRAVHVTHLKPLPSRVHSWRSAHPPHDDASSPSVPPSYLCLSCGHIGPAPPPSPAKAAKEQKEAEAGDGAKEQPPQASEANRPPSADNHFLSVHSVAVDLLSPSLASCVCYRCSLSLSDALQRSPTHAKLLRLSAFITSIQSPLASSFAAAPSAADDGDVSAFTAASSDGAVSGPLRGLRNNGNTCYFNSVAQCLASTAPLWQLLRRPPRTSPFPLQAQLSAFLHSVNADSAARPAKRFASNDSLTISPAALLAAIAASHPLFKGNRQHDAHELLRALLNAAVGEGEEEAKKRKRESLVRQLSGWGMTEVVALVGKAGLGAKEEDAVMKALEEVAVKEDMRVDGRLVVRLLERWEQKDGRRWRKALAAALSPAEKDALEALFRDLRKFSRSRTPARSSPSVCTPPY